MDEHGEGNAQQGEEGAEEWPAQRRWIEQQRNQDEFHAICSQNATLQRELEALKVQLECFVNCHERQQTVMNNNLHRLMIQLARVVRNETAAAVVPQPVIPQVAVASVAAVNVAVNTNNANLSPAASLSPLPRTLHALWHEFEFGIGGRKPAHDFTASERGGKNKHSYYHRRVVWDAVDALVHGGWSANAACDRIYDIYGCNQSVTCIIK